MVTKKVKRAGKSVKDLRVKALTAKDAKRVAGGGIVAGTENANRGVENPTTRFADGSVFKVNKI